MTRWTGGAAIALALFGVTPALTAQQPPAAPGPRRAEGPLADSLRLFAMHMAELLRARDADAVAALYGDTLDFVHIDNGHVVTWAQMAPMMRNYLRTADANPIYVVGEPGVTVLDQNTAVVYIVHRIEAHAGRPGHEGVWTGVLRRQREGWTIVHSHSSDREAAPER